MRINFLNLIDKVIYYFSAGNSSSTTIQPTTPDGNGNSNTTNSPYTGSTDGSASQIVLIVLLVSI